MELLGSLSKDDGDGNENCRNAFGLDFQKTNLHVHLAFVPYISWSSLPSSVWNFLISRFIEDLFFDAFLFVEACHTTYPFPPV